MNWKASDIKWLDCEISSLCNAGCVDCNRWIYNYSMDQMQLNSYNQHMDEFVDLKKFLKRIEKIPNLKYILLQGNVGDPMTHPKISEIVEGVFRLFPNIRLEINTNGSIGSFSNWQKLSLLSHHNMSIVFSIDGLSDTNHIYRRGCDWKKIMRNAKLWIDAGGEAEWLMIDFPFNKHQREEAKNLSGQLGFSKFTITERYSPTDKMDNFIIKKSTEPVKKIWFDQSTLPIEYEIEYHKIESKKYKDWSVKPACKDVNGDNWDHWPNFHLNVEGTLWPCCFTSNLPYLRGDRLIWQKIDNRYQSKYGLNWNNLDFRTLQEILDTDWFTKDLSDSWNIFSLDNISLCRKNCGDCKNSYVWKKFGNLAVDKSRKHIDA